MDSLIDFDVIVLCLLWDKEKPRIASNLGFFCLCLQSSGIMGCESWLKVCFFKSFKCNTHMHTYTPTHFYLRLICIYNSGVFLVEKDRSLSFYFFKTCHSWLCLSLKIERYKQHLGSKMDSLNSDMESLEFLMRRRNPCHPQSSPSLEISDNLFAMFSWLPVLSG